MLGQSVKEKDPFKVGKFGLGFKSVFHMTGEKNNMLVGKRALRFGWTLNSQ